LDAITRRATGLIMEWISIKDKLPEKDTKVLVFYHDEYMDVMEYWHDDEDGMPEFYGPPASPVNSVTHWMPLPDKPK
jgi:hypothetical protein